MMVIKLLIIGKLMTKIVIFPARVIASASPEFPALLQMPEANSIT